MQSGNAAMTLDQPLRFVLHGHFASHHHFDFRLERDGVLKSWAVPKELPEKSGERRLAIMVESNRENRLPNSPLIRTVRATFTAHGSSTSQPDIGRQQGVPISLLRRAGIFHTTLSFDGRVEDHTLDYIGFQGTIPEGQYGAGEVTIKDTGTYNILIWRDDRIEVFLHGQVFSGKYVLIRFKKAGEKDWLVFRAKE